MKAIQVTRFGEPDVLNYLRVPDPLVAADQVLIEVKGASVNFADIKARQGGYHLGKKPPFIPGIDVAGIVIEVGSKVTRFGAGDRVLAFPASGSYAQKCVAAESLSFAIPDSVDFITAAACPIAAGTVTHMLTSIARIKSHERLLVHAAAGGVGTMAVEVAKALGIKIIFGSTGSPWKIERLGKKGLMAIVDYTGEDYPESIKALTDGEGVDVILNPIGGRSINRDLKCLAPFGRIVQFGMLSGEPSAVPVEVLHPTNRSITGFSFGHYRKFRPELIQATMDRLIGFLEQGEIEVTIDRCLPLSEAAQAHRCLENREAVGKIVLVDE
jgi:NADPH2:quinone reductase